MNRFDFDWLAQLRELGGGSWIPMVGTLAAVAALMVLWRVVRGRQAGSGYDASADQFLQTAPITEEQVRLLHYLQQAFADGVVLFRPRLARFLMVRRSRRRLEAQRRLAEAQVDFLVCADDGKPLFAFEVDAFKQRDDPELARGAAEKNLMLKSAGIRLIRLKGALSNWPAPEVLRERLLAAQRTPGPGADARASGFSPSGFGRSSFGHTDFVPSRGVESGVMSLTGLMGLTPAENPWESVRKR
jgi:hypothetical protein